MRPHRLLIDSAKALLISCGLLSAAALHHAQASASELVQTVGRPLLAYANAIHDGGLRTVVVNGAALRMRVGTTRDSLDDVLASEGRRCGKQPMVLTRSADHAFIGCIEPPKGSGLIRRLRAFAAHGDLAQLGELRVTWAMRAGEQVRYVALASNGGFDLFHMFPARGDAPGVDVTGVPRPPRARRILSTWQQGAEPMLVSYRSELSMEHLPAAQRARLVAAGFRIERASQLEDDQLALVARRGEQLLLALLAPDGPGTLISILPLATNATAIPKAR